MTTTTQSGAFGRQCTEVFIQDFVGKQTGTIVRYTQELHPGQAPIGVMTNLITGTRREFPLSSDLMDTDPLNVWYPGMHWRIRQELTERTRWQEQKQRNRYLPGEIRHEAAVEQPAVQPRQPRKRYAGRWLKRDNPAVVR